MNPGVSCVATGFCPMAWAKAHAFWKVSSEVARPGDISISFINCAGRQKCMPTKQSGRPDPPAIWVIDIVDVLDAKMVLGWQTSLSLPNN
ncbi:hypothetical protein D3C87_1885160 [compost metagenome]